MSIRTCRPTARLQTFQSIGQQASSLAGEAMPSSSFSTIPGTGLQAGHKVQVGQQSGGKMTTEKTVPKQLKPFQKGQSGNPSGRPKGARNKATLAMEALLDGEADRLARKAVEMALAGDTTALRLCLERIMPPRKDRPVTFALPKLEIAADAVKATAALVEAVARGDITPAEAAELSKLVERFIRAVEVHDIQVRLERLEAHQESRR
jgi:hypothetical protein